MLLSRIRGLKSWKNGNKHYNFNLTETIFGIIKNTIIMKALYKYILILAMFIVVNSAHAQIVESQIINDIDSICSFIIQDNTMKEIIKRVLPNVKFEYRMNTKRGGKGLVYIYQGSTYSDELFNMLLLDLKYIEDSTRIYSNEDLIKSYMYLGIASGQSTNSINFPVQFNISGAPNTYIGEFDEYYKKIGFNNRDLNYHAEASWSEPIYNQNNVTVKKAVFDFNIIDGEIISVVKKVFSNGHKVWDKGLYAPVYSKEMEKLRPAGRDYRIKELKEEKKKNSDILNSIILNDKVEAINNNAYVKLKDDELGKNYINMLTANYVGGVAYITDAKSKFKLTGCSIGMLNPILKIFTCIEFGSRVELFSCNLTVSSDGTAITNSYFTPVDNDRDGFCCFELYDGQVLISVCL
ncbi:MAG: hypothetical protein ACOYMF_14165 [Bacteroidales bacterium]